MMGAVCVAGPDRGGGDHGQPRGAAGAVLRLQGAGACGAAGRRPHHRRRRCDGAAAVQLTAVAGARTPYQEAENHIAQTRRGHIAASATVAACCCAAWDYSDEEMDLM